MLQITLAPLPPRRAPGGRDAGDLVTMVQQGEPSPAVIAQVDHYAVCSPSRCRFPGDRARKLKPEAIRRPIQQHVERQEAHESFRHEAVASWAEYQQTGGQRDTPLATRGRESQEDAEALARREYSSPRVQFRALTGAGP